MRSSYQTQAIILHSLDYGESDRILTFYSNDFGKLKGIAKGARRSKKRFPNALEQFSLLNLFFSRKESNSLVFIENCDVINHHSNIKNSLEKTLYSSYILELTDKFTLEGKRDPLLFQLLGNFLILIENGVHEDKSVLFFELHLLKVAGYEPVLDRCSGCMKTIDNNNSYHFYPGKAGIRCSLCREEDLYSLPVSTGTIRSLIMAKDMDIKNINRLSLSVQYLAEGRNILSCLIRQHLGKELNSLRVLNEIRKIVI